MDDYGPLPIVLDNGSSVCRVGYAGEDNPRAQFRSFVGWAHQSDETNGIKLNDTFVGSQAQEKRHLLSLTYPIERGVVTDWDAMEQVWNHLFSAELQVPPSERPVLVTEGPLNPKTNSEGIMQHLFETFNVPALYAVLPALLACYGSGRGRGLFVDSGDGVTQVMPVWQTQTIRNAIARVDLAGRDVTTYMAEMLRARGYSLSTPAELETVKELKDALSYVALDYEQAIRTAQGELAVTKTYTCPDGRKIEVQDELFRAPEILFEPGAFHGNDSDGIHAMVFNAINKCDVDLRRDFYGNIFLSGGNTMIPGYAERMKKELTTLVPGRAKVVVIAPADREIMVWIGGSIITSLSTLKTEWVTRKEYDEVGPAIVHRKCMAF